MLHYPTILFEHAEVLNLHAGGHAKATVKYAPRFAFGYAQIDRDNLVDSAAWVEVKVCIWSSYFRTGPLNFGPATKREDTNDLVFKNDTNDRANLSLGFVIGDGTSEHYEPTLLWTGVGSGSQVTAQFTPILEAYVIRNYKESELLRGEVETDVIWSRNLNEIDDVTGWNLIENDTDGSFAIEPANS